MNEIYEYAKKYRDLGWNVIPLYNFSKNPAPLRWKEYQDRMSTDEEFEEWFNNDRVTGVGLITGRLSGIVVLDEDIYKEGGKKVAIKTGMLSETARHGKHHFFKYIEPIKSSGFKEGINVEIKADGGFVVLPPTKVVLEGVEGQYIWIDKCFPEDLMEIREDMLTPFRAGGKANDSVKIMSLINAKLGTQHNNLRSLSLSILNRFSQKEWSLAEEVIRDLAAKFDPPHPLDRIEKMIRDCENFVRSHPKEEVEEEIEKEPISPRSINDIASLRVEDRKLEDAAPKTGWPELDRLIKGFIPGHIYTLTGDTNVGKTTIACNFVESLRQQQKSSLYIALEPDVNLVEYLASVRHKKRFDQLTDEDLFVNDPNVHIFLQQDVKTVQDLIEALKGIRKRYDLIIIDHIGYFVRTDRDWVQQQSNVIKELAFLAKGNKSAVMMIAHLRKPGFMKKNQEWKPTANDISGSGAFKQDSTEVLIAHRDVRPQDQYAVSFADLGALVVAKTKVGPNGGFGLIFSEKSAKVWSQEEAQKTVEGRMFLDQRNQNNFDYAMGATTVWESQDKNED